MNLREMRKSWLCMICFVALEGSPLERLRLDVRLCSRVTRMKMHWKLTKGTTLAPRTYAPTCHVIYRFQRMAAATTYTDPLRA